jgi:hypothetical protein
VVFEPGFTALGNEISARDKSPRGSDPGLKVAVAPLIETELTFALEFNRTVNVLPAGTSDVCGCQVGSDIDESLRLLDIYGKVK